jgi:hypothetical protein
MPFHDITELPAEFCEPKTAKNRELSVSDRIQITELLHRVYLCEDSRDYDALKKILVDDTKSCCHTPRISKALKTLRVTVSPCLPSGSLVASGGNPQDRTNSLCQS